MTQTSGPKTAQQVIKNLHNFNRKERDHLMKLALSDTPDRPQLSKGLWRAIRTENGRRQRPAPQDMFIGMDYHLNWLYAALMVSDAYEQHGIGQQPNQWPKHVGVATPPERPPIQGNQEDVDLLVAFPADDGVLHLALIEAKLTSGWSSSQFRSKIRRLNLIREAARGQDYAGPEISWQFMLASPKPPKKGDFSAASLADIPSWIKGEPEGSATLRHIVFGPERLYQVKRDSSKGVHWQIQHV